jgi:CRISPR system Cascade subunit CasB
VNEKDFVAYLKELAAREDRGALAALRRGLGRPPGTAAEMYPYLVPRLPEGWGWRQECYYVIAALFALHPDRPWPGQGNLGDTFRAMAQQDAARPGEIPEAVERRFVALLKCRRDDLFDHLRHAVGLARSKEAGVHWEQLMQDIRNWDREDRRVQRHWAQSFWGGAAGAVEQTESPAAVGEKQ